jgi:hypothetical protein
MLIKELFSEQKAAEAEDIYLSASKRCLLVENSSDYKFFNYSWNDKLCNLGAKY